MSEGIKSGLSFTQTLDNFSASQGGNQRIDVLEDGSLGERISKSSGTVQYWEQLGGSFTPEESLHLNNTPVPQARSYATEEERVMNSQIGRRLPPEEVAKFKDFSVSDAQEYIDIGRAGKNDDPPLFAQSSGSLALLVVIGLVVVP